MSTLRITMAHGDGIGPEIMAVIRKSLELYANVRACLFYAPFVKTKHPSMDMGYKLWK